MTRHGGTQVTEQEYGALTALLTAEVEALTGMCEAAAAQSAALLRAEPQAVLAAVALGDTQARRLRAVETERAALLQTHASPTLAALVAVAPEPYRSQMQALRKQALDLVSRIRADNDTNHQFATTCLRFSQRYLGALRDSLGATPGYANAGQAAGGKASGLLDRRA